MKQMLKHAKLVNKPVFGKFELIVLAINSKYYFQLVDAIYLTWMIKV